MGSLPSVIFTLASIVFEFKLTIMLPLEVAHVPSHFLEVELQLKRMITHTTKRERNLRGCFVIGSILINFFVFFNCVCYGPMKYWVWD